ncbi:MAG TPA: rhodanese-like domain-containing protein [Ktedonobacteraceae bacterium]
MMQDDNGVPRFRSKAEMLSIANEVSITPDSTVNVYCFKGARASNTLVALNEAGVKDVRIYFASWNEWFRDPSLPIEEGPLTTHSSSQFFSENTREKMVLELIKRTNNSKGHINSFLDDQDQADALEADLGTVRQLVYELPDEIGCGENPMRKDILKDVVRARILISELSLRASQSAMLHAGASGYRLHSIFAQKLHESYFVAIVTPVLKHLKKLQHMLLAQD